MSTCSLRQGSGYAMEEYGDNKVTHRRALVNHTFRAIYNVLDVIQHHLIKIVSFAMSLQKLR